MSEELARARGRQNAPRQQERNGRTENKGHHRHRQSHQKGQQGVVDPGGAEVPRPEKEKLPRSGQLTKANTRKYSALEKRKQTQRTGETGSYSLLRRVFQRAN